MWPFSNDLTNLWTAYKSLNTYVRTKLEDLMSALSDKMNTMNAKIDHLLDMAVAQQKQINDLMADKADIDAVMASMDAEMTKIDGVLNPEPPPEG